MSECLLTLMKLKLGLVHKDLAKQFHISPSLASQIYISFVAHHHVYAAHIHDIHGLDTVI